MAFRRAMAGSGGRFRFPAHPRIRIAGLLASPAPATTQEGNVELEKLKEVYGELCEALETTGGKLERLVALLKETGVYDQYPGVVEGASYQQRHNAALVAKARAVLEQEKENDSS